MTTSKVSLSDPSVRAVVRAAFPHYRGRRIELVTGGYPPSLDSYWDGGSKDFYVFVDLPGYEAGRRRHLETLPTDVALVRHSIVCGKDAGVTIYIRRASLVPSGRN